MEETFSYVWVLYAKENKPIEEHRIVNFLRDRIPAHSVMQVLSVMVKSNMFEISIGNTGFHGYKPNARWKRLGG
jgi:hypothetical protein